MTMPSFRTISFETPPTRDQAALFFDRDGTLNHDPGYLSDPDGVVLLPGVAEAIAELRGSFRLYLFTNQSGVARGYFGMEAVEAVNKRLCELLGDPDVFDGVCIAPEHPDDPPVYRKPSPRYLLETIAGEGLDPDRCVMFGDRTSDLEAAFRAGIHAIRITADRDDPAAAAYAEAHRFETMHSIADFADRLRANTPINRAPHGQTIPSP